MNLVEEFLEQAKKVLKEDAGSEGMAYILEYKGTLKDVDGVEFEDKTDGKCTVKFSYPRDYGFALQTITDMGVEVVALELLF